VERGVRRRRLCKARRCARGDVAIVRRSFGLLSAGGRSTGDRTTHSSGTSILMSLRIVNGVIIIIIIIPIIIITSTVTIIIIIIIIIAIIIIIGIGDFAFARDRLGTSRRCAPRRFALAKTDTAARSGPRAARPHHRREFARGVGQPSKEFGTALTAPPVYTAVRRQSLLRYTYRYKREYLGYSDRF